MTTLLLIPTRIERAGLSLPEMGGVQLRLCGMGIMAAAVAATRWLAELRPTDCVLAGLAGTRDAGRAPLGSLVVGTAVRNEAVGAGHAAAFSPLHRMAPRGEDVAPDPLPLVIPPRWMEIAPQLPLQGAQGIDVVAGELGTVATASASVSEADAWLSRDPGVLAEEMEGYAVALACRAAEVPMSIVRGVSNRAGVRDKDDWDVSGALGALRRFLTLAHGAQP